MIQKVLKVGSSAAVTIPKKVLDDFGIKIGDRINVTIDTKNRVVSFKASNQLSQEDEKIARLTFGFISRYRKDLEELARK